MTRLVPGSADQFALYQLHKALGVMLLLVVVARIGWRLTRTALLWPAQIPAFARSTARFVHAALYLGLVAVPMTGWTVVSVSPFKIPTSIFGLGTWPTLPVLPDLDPEWRGRIEPVLVQVHAMLAYALIGLVLLHATAAVWHGRTVLTRMVPGWRSRPTP